MKWQLAAALILVLFLFLYPWLRADREEDVPHEDKIYIAPRAETDGMDTISVLIDGVAEEMTIQDYLCCVLRAEMPASFELEALKAQSVAARTYTYYQTASPKHAEADVCADSTCCQAFMTAEDAAEAWGDNASKYEEKIQRAVYATDGEVILYGGEPILAAFHASSAGRTKDVSSVWLSELPYLKSVESPESEETVPNYCVDAQFTPEELKSAISAIAPEADFSADPGAWLGAVETDESGGVATITIGGAVLRGTAVRTALSLRSTTFTAAYTDGEFVFSTTGHGHGVGMSQYGANTLAAQGYTYDEILTWYYTGVTIEKLPEA